VYNDYAICLEDQEIVVWFSSRGNVIFLFSKAVRPLLGSAQPHNHWVLEALSSELIGKDVRQKLAI
jgi:hypothetical protein